MTDVLVYSPVPGANEALSAGFAARVAAVRAEWMRGEETRRLARPLPEGGRELRWANENRANYRREVEAAERDAAELGSRYALLLGAVAEVAPETAVLVNESIWRAER